MLKDRYIQQMKRLIPKGKRCCTEYKHDYNYVKLCRFIVVGNIDGVGVTLGCSTCKITHHNLGMNNILTGDFLHKTCRYNKLKFNERKF